MLIFQLIQEETRYLYVKPIEANRENGFSGSLRGQNPPKKVNKSAI